MCGKACCGECTCLPEDARPYANPNLWQRLREDIDNVFNKDPAARSTLEVLTSYPGLHAIWLHRVSHWLWSHGALFPARYLSHIGRWLTGIEIHPGATIGRRFFIDHGMGVVIGETAEVGDDVLLYKGVVLGGVSMEKTKRHPTIGNGVIVGSNAVILGPIEVGNNSKIGSGAVVVKPVPAFATVVGVPGQVVKVNGVKCRRMPDLHHELLPDVVSESLQAMQRRIDELSAQVAALQGQAGSAMDVDAPGGANEGETAADQEPVCVAERSPA
ncbi:MAG: serine O-acetyltransferase [Anaerolineae bacterium]|nr:serine O-acetyltransferase [Anaerolineae bacterium]